MKSVLSKVITVSYYFNNGCPYNYWRFDDLLRTSILFLIKVSEKESLDPVTPKTLPCLDTYLSNTYLTFILTLKHTLYSF